MNLEPTGEEREFTLYFENLESPNNVVLVQVGVREKGGETRRQGDRESARRVSPEEIPFGGLAPAKELEVLAGIVGEWTMAERAEPSVRYPSGFTSTGEMSVRWTHNRHFISGEGSLVREADGKKQRVEFTLVTMYDRAKQAYRRWSFVSEGFASESVGQWDANTNTMSWEPVGLPPNTMGEAKSVVGKDRQEFSIFIKRDDGTVLTDIKSTMERKPR
jgi:hypothetical protein